MKFSETISLDEDLLKDLPNLEVLKDNQYKFFRPAAVANGEFNFINVKDRSEEYIIDIRTLLPQTEMGMVLNIDDFYQSLKDASLNQEIIDYQKDKGLVSY